MTELLLSAADVSGTDPLARLLSRLRLSPLRWLLAFFLAGAAYMGGLAAGFGYFLPRPGIIASQSDVFNQLNFLIIFPAVAFYYLWQPGAIARAYAGISRLTPDATEAALWADIRRVDAQAGWWLAALALALLGMAAGAYDNFARLGVWWYAANGLMISGLQLSRGLIFYMLVVIAGRHFAAALGLNRCYKQFDLPVNVLPVRQGGLAAIATYAFSFTVLMAVVGLNLGTAPVLSTRLGVDYPYQVLAYFLVAPLGFVLPFWQAHRHMVRHKARLLDELAQTFQAEHTQLMRNLTHEPAQASGNLARLQSLHEAYAWTKKAAVWPFDTEMYYQIGATIVAPFLLTIVQVALGWIIR